MAERDGRDRQDAAFVDLVTATRPRLYRTALAVAGDAAAAEDAVQGALVKAYASWRRVRRADHPEAYLRRMVLNEVLGSRRRGFGQRERASAEVTPREHVPSPESAAVDRDAVWTAVQALPPRQRAVVVLRYYEDLSEAEIADALGCARGTVKSQASAALRSLRAAGLADPEGATA